MSVCFMLLGEGLREKDYDEISDAGGKNFELSNYEDTLLMELSLTSAETRECIRRLGIEDLNILCYSSFNDEDEQLFALHEWDPEGTAWLWKGQKTRRAPLDVAAAADRLAAAVARKDPDAEFLVERNRVDFLSNEKMWRRSDPTRKPATPAEQDSYARSTIALMCEKIAINCRLMAARGVTNVMAAAEPM